MVFGCYQTPKLHLKQQTPDALVRQTGAKRQNSMNQPLLPPSRRNPSLLITLQHRMRKPRNGAPTYVMGPPSAPNVHPDNQQAALWNASGHQQISEHPYLLYTPIEKSDKSTQKSFEPVIHKFQEWGKTADTVARNIWHNLKTGPSVPQAAWGKVNLTAKAITEGGFESLFKHVFETDSNEKLKKTFACYLSTSTGPVAGTLYLSTARVAFCSDRPLCHTAPSGEEAWSYYKVMIPLEKISTVNSEIMIENPSRKYIQIVTTDEHDFWFMGFVNFEKALQNLSESVSSFKEAGSAIQPVVA